MLSLTQPWTRVCAAAGSGAAEQVKQQGSKPTQTGQASNAAASAAIPQKQRKAGKQTQAQQVSFLQHFSCSRTQLQNFYWICMKLTSTLKTAL